MANRNYPDKHGSESKNMGQYYMVESGRVFRMDIIERTKEREMIIETALWLWRFPGRVCLGTAFAAFIFKWFSIGDVKSFITLSIAAITGISKVIIMWAEKGDVVKAKWKRLIQRRKRIKP